MKFFSNVLFIVLLSSTLSYAQQIDLYSGDKFLGCVNCNKSSADSICNKYGKYGSPYSQESIFNKHTTYGYRNNPLSPWNDLSISNDVPALVAKNGMFYGYFTINDFRSRRVKFSDELREMYDLADGDLKKVQELFCENIKQRKFKPR